MYILSRVRGPRKLAIDTDLAVTTKNSYIRKTDRMRTQKAKYIYTDTVKFPKRDILFKLLSDFHFVFLKLRAERYGDLLQVVISYH